VSAGIARVALFTRSSLEKTMRYFQTRESFIPEGAAEITREGIDAVVYTHTDSRGRPYAIGFGGKRNRPDWNYMFRSPEARDRKIDEFFAGQKAHAELMRQRRSQGQSEVAQRNAAIKRLLETRYGKGKVSVTGDRGTAYGWVNVKIDAHWPAGRHPEVTSEITQFILNAGIKLYSYSSGDYGEGYKISIAFSQDAPSTDFAQMEE
jgi:hypothetical protein